MIPTKNNNTIHFKQWLLSNCLPYDLEILTVNGGEKISRNNTQITVANFTRKRKKIQSGYFTAILRSFAVFSATLTKQERQSKMANRLITDLSLSCCIKHRLYSASYNRLSTQITPFSNETWGILSSQSLSTFRLNLLPTASGNDSPVFFYLQ